MTHEEQPDCLRRLRAMSSEEGFDDYSDNEWVNTSREVIAAFEQLHAETASLRDQRDRLAQANAELGVATVKALADVLTERQRQVAKWGEYDHLLVGNPHAPLQAVHGPDARFEARSAALIECHRLGIPSEREAKEACEREHREGRGTFATILVEELAEAVSACVIHGETSDEARKELVQVAAVVVAMIERIDAQRATACEVRTP